MSVNHHQYMQRCIELAKQAETAGEVPVGAVVVYQNEIIAEGFNQPISTSDPTSHAELIALRKACVHFDNYRLPEGSQETLKIIPLLQQVECCKKNVHLYCQTFSVKDVS